MWRVTLTLFPTIVEVSRELPQKESSLRKTLLSASMIVGGRLIWKYKNPDFNNPEPRSLRWFSQVVKPHQTPNWPPADLFVRVSAKYVLRMLSLSPLQKAFLCHPQTRDVFFRLKPKKHPQARDVFFPPPEDSSLQRMWGLP